MVSCTLIQSVGCSVAQESRWSLSSTISYALRASEWVRMPRKLGLEAERTFTGQSGPRQPHFCPVSSIPRRAASFPFLCLLGYLPQSYRAVPRSLFSTFRVFPVEMNFCSTCPQVCFENQNK